MDTAPLTLFAQKVSAGKRLLFADLRRLRRDVLPDGITTREEAEVLLTVDRNLERADEEWTDYLVVMVTDFALSTSGTINQDTARWLAGVLSIARPKTTAAIARESSTGLIRRMRLLCPGEEFRETSAP
jgi:hypothetical protein